MVKNIQNHNPNQKHQGLRHCLYWGSVVLGFYLAGNLTCFILDASIKVIHKKAGIYLGGGDEGTFIM